MSQGIELDGRRIALVMMSAIGDVVHALPLVNSIRSAAPDVHLTWVIQPVPRQLLGAHPAVDEYLTFHRSRGWRAFADFFRAARRHRFDLVLDPHVYFKAGVVTGMLHAPRKIGFDRKRAPDLNWLFSTERIRARPRAHAQDEMLEFVDHLGIPRVLRWGLEPTPEELTRFDPLLPADPRPTIALALASSRPDKDWPADRYAPLVRHLLAALGCRVVLVGGRTPTEERIAADLTERFPAVLDLREWDLRRLAFLLHRADAMVSPDTGPMHIAVALGTPTVALMGYTNPKRVGPYRFRELTIDAFGDPGEEYDATAGYRPGRMSRISVDQVAAKVELALEQGSGTRNEEREERGSCDVSGPAPPEGSATSDRQAPTGDQRRL